MKRYCFVMDDGSRHDVIAASFHAACLQWQQFGLDPRNIAAMECR